MSQLIATYKNSIGIVTISVNDNFDIYSDIRKNNTTLAFASIDEILADKGWKYCPYGSPSKPFNCNTCRELNPLAHSTCEGDTTNIKFERLSKELKDFINHSDFPEYHI